MGEINEIKVFLDQVRPELVIEHKTDFLSGNGINSTSNLNLLRAKQRKLFFCSIKHFHVDFIDKLNNGDILGIHGVDPKESYDFKGLFKIRQKIFSGNGYSSLFWIKGEYDIKDYITQPDDETIDVVVTSSSRSLLLPYCIESFKKRLITDRKLRWILHEDFVFEKESKTLLEQNSHHFDHVFSHNPAIGLGCSLDFLLPKVKSKYMFYIQDDFFLERPVELDRILWTMDRHPKINLILLNKYRNIRNLGGFGSKEFDFDGLKLFLYNGWSFNPGVWRISKVREKWVKSQDVNTRVENLFNKQFRLEKDRFNVDICYEKLGAFFYGAYNEPRYIRHIGGTWRMGAWRMENGKPGGDPKYDNLGDQHRASWVSYREFPTYEG